MSELVRMGLIDPKAIRYLSPFYVRPSTRNLVSYVSTCSFEQNKRCSSTFFAQRNPSKFLLSVRNNSNCFVIRSFRTRAPSTGIGTSRDVGNEASVASNQSEELHHAKEQVGEKVLKLNVKLDDLKGSLSIDETSLAPEERDRVRVCFICRSVIRFFIVVPFRLLSQMVIWRRRRSLKRATNGKFFLLSKTHWPFF